VVTRRREISQPGGRGTGNDGGWAFFGESVCRPQQKGKKKGRGDESIPPPTRLRKDKLISPFWAHGIWSRRGGNRAPLLHDQTKKVQKKSFAEMTRKGGGRQTKEVRSRKKRLCSPGRSRESVKTGRTEKGRKNTCDESGSSQKRPPQRADIRETKVQEVSFGSLRTPCKGGERALGTWETTDEGPCVCGWWV